MVVRPRNIIIDSLVLLLVALNLCATLFPAILLDPANLLSNDTYFAEYNAALFNAVSSIISPISMALGILVFLLGCGREGTVSGSNRQIIGAAALVFFAVALSASVNMTGGPKMAFIVLYFMVVNLFLFGVMEYYSIPAGAVLLMLRRVLTVWALLPLALMIVYPPLVAYFVKPMDLSFHGFIDSRVGYGLWLGLLIILLLTQPDVYFRKWLLFFSVIALLLCQSRAAIGSIGLSYAYFYYREHGGLNRASMAKIGLLFFVIITALIVWSAYGRGNVFTAVDNVRSLVYTSYFNYISENWLFGYGAMYSVTVPGLLTEAPAHNLLLQTLANFGVIALLAFMVYWVMIFFAVKSTVSRMLLIFFFAYSQLEPVQGTANFFSPITFTWFIAIVLLRRSRFVGKKLVI